MNYKIKCKLINGEKRFGLINDKLETALPFEYANIEEKTYEVNNMFDRGKRNYYILTSPNNKKGIFFECDNKPIFIYAAYDYIDYIPNSYFRFIVGQLVEDKMEYGILERKFKSYESYTDKMVYPFGKADSIEIEKGKVVLYKTKGNRILKGVFDDPNLGTYDPKYTQLDLCIAEAKFYPFMPDPKTYYGGDKWWFGSEKWPIQYIEYGKIKNKKEVKGVLVKDIIYGEYYPSPIKTEWNELVPSEYSNCIIDTKENLIHLSQRKNKKELKGLMGFSTYWNIHTEHGTVKGNCTYVPEFTIPCDFDSVKLFDDRSEHYTFHEKNKRKYFIVEKDGKFGLIKVCYSLSRGPFDNQYQIPKASVEVLLYWNCDHIFKVGNAFGFTIDGKDGLLIDEYRDKYENLLRTDCNYKAINSILGVNYNNQMIYEITDFNDKKSVVAVNKVEKDVYELKQTPFDYDNISENRIIIQCSKKVAQKKQYDIYNDNLNLIEANADSVEFKDYMYKTSTNIDEDTTRIKFFDSNGTVLLDERGKGISAAYSRALDSFIISRDNIIQVKKPLNEITDEGELDIQGDYKVFDVNENGFIIFQKAIENSKVGVYKFNGRNNKITVLLDEEYAGANIVANGTRTIVAKIIDSKMKYGVKENTEGNECISIEHDEITVDGENFIASNYDNDVIQSTKFDVDGFYLSSETIENPQYKKVLKRNNLKPQINEQ